MKEKFHSIKAKTPLFYILVFVLLILIICGIAFFSYVISTFQMNNSETNQQLHKKWYLQTINSDEVSQSLAFLEFRSDNTVSGFGGCNNFSSTYTISANRISFGTIASTDMFCEDIVDIEGAYLRILGEAKTFTITENVLAIFSETDQLGLTNNPIRSDGIVGEWQYAESLEGDAIIPVLDNTQIILDIESTGNFTVKSCNTSTGTYTIDSNSIQFARNTVTDNTCTSPQGAMEQENKFINDLSHVYSFEITDSQILRLFYSDNSYQEFKIVGNN